MARLAQHEVINTLVLSPSSRLIIGENALVNSDIKAAVEQMRRAIDEGGQSLLDSSLLMFCSNLFDGDKHQADQMPIVLAGRGGGSVETGRVLDYLDRGDDNRRACSLYLSLMDRMGVCLPRFGDTQRRLADL